MPCFYIAMENCPENNEKVPRLDIDGLVYALEISGDGDRVYGFVFDVVPLHYPESIVDLYRKLALHPSRDIRITAAIGVESVILIDEEAGLEIAEKLLQDEDSLIVEQVKETVKSAASSDELPTTSLDRLDKLSSKYV